MCKVWKKNDVTQKLGVDVLLVLVFCCLGTDFVVLCRPGDEMLDGKGGIFSLTLGCSKQTFDGQAQSDT